MQDISELRREDVYKKLRGEILSCAITPGQSLHENDLADRFGVSKSPIRDALMRLEADGLVIVQSRKGYRVAPVSISDAGDLFEFRSTLEEAVADMVAESATDEELASLDRFRSYEEWNDKGGFVVYNRAFHGAVTGLCKNQRLAAAALDLIEQFDRLILISLAVIGPYNYDRPLAEHNAIIDSLQARESRKASRLVGRHIGRGRKRVIGALSQAAVIV
jgi:DNA-binding GntR family transcriptional regulator